jgi:hypothetical protein
MVGSIETVICGVGTTATSVGSAVGARVAVWPDSQPMTATAATKHRRRVNRVKAGIPSS